MVEFSVVLRNLAITFACIVAGVYFVLMTAKELILF